MLPRIEKTLGIYIFLYTLDALTTCIHMCIFLYLEVLVKCIRFKLITCGLGIPAVTIA